MRLTRQHGIEHKAIHMTSLAWYLTLFPGSPALEQKYVGRAWYLFSREHDAITKGQNVQNRKATFYTLFIQLNTQCVGYRIALNFRGPKFSQIAISLKHNLQIRCTHTPHGACQKFSLKCFRKQLKIHEIKDPQKFCAIRYLLLAIYIGLQKRPFCDSALWYLELHSLKRKFCYSATTASEFLSCTRGISATLLPQ